VHWIEGERSNPLRWSSIVPNCDPTGSGLSKIEHTDGAGSGTEGQSTVRSKCQCRNRGTILADAVGSWHNTRLDWLPDQNASIAARGS
jgi:hypothetical protein